MREGQAVAGVEPDGLADDDQATADRSLAVRLEAARSRRFRTAPFIVVLLGLAATLLLTWVSRFQYDHNEHRLITLRVKEAGSVLSGNLPSFQTPLASAAALADASGGNATLFRNFMGAYVGPKSQFTSAALFVAGTTHQVASIGSPLALAADPAAMASFLGRVPPPATLRVTELLQGSERRLGYAFRTAGTVSTFVAYGEIALPANRRLKSASNSAFADLHYALYLDRNGQPSDLIATDVAQLPLTGHTATATVPFGDSNFTLVMSPSRPMSGVLAERLPWIILVLGALLTLGAGLLTARLERRRRQTVRLAERLEGVARENRQLYAEQRSVAEVLQRALLPEALPAIAGAETAVHYLPGVKGMHVGGDWYDVIVLDDTHVLFVVGDVSGRGVRSATVMASLLYAVRAYAAQGDPPETILTRLSGLFSVERTGHFATVLCILVDFSAGQMTVANAGHLPPLVLQCDGAEFVETHTGVPVGVASTSPYVATTVALQPNSTLLAYTDGLVERRGESIDEGMRRLRTTAVSAQHPSLSDLLSTVVRELIGDGVDDDAVVLGLRW